VNPATGETRSVPVSIDPGWLVDGRSPVDGQSPVISPNASLSKLLDRKLAVLGAVPAPTQAELF
jgi:hypothetical protein